MLARSHRGLAVANPHLPGWYPASIWIRSCRTCQRRLRTAHAARRFTISSFVTGIAPWIISRPYGNAQSISEVETGGSAPLAGTEDSGPSPPYPTATKRSARAACRTAGGLPMSESTGGPFDSHGLGWANQFAIFSAQRAFIGLPIGAVTVASGCFEPAAVQYRDVSTVVFTQQSEI